MHLLPQNLAVFLSSLHQRFVSSLLHYYSPATLFPRPAREKALALQQEYFPTASSFSALAAVIILVSIIIIIAVMSRRFTPLYTVPKVGNRDYEYIKPYSESTLRSRSNNRLNNNNDDDDEGPDIILLQHFSTTYPLYFPAFSISDGELNVGDVRGRAAEVTGTQDPSNVKLLYKGKLLKNDAQSCRDDGLKQESKVLCVISNVVPSEHGSVSGSENENVNEDDDDDEEDEPSLSSVISPMNDEKEKEKKKKNNKKKKDNLNKKKKAKLQKQQESSVPSISTLPPPSPDLKQFPAALEKIKALESYFESVLSSPCKEYAANPPPMGKAREYEYKKLTETSMAQVLLKTDGIDTTGDEVARNARKALVKEVLSTLAPMDRVPRE